MNARNPALLSDALLASKGSATVLGFRIPDKPRKDRRGAHRPAWPAPLWALSCCVLILAVALVLDRYAEPRDDPPVVAAEPESRIVAALGQLDTGSGGDETADATPDAPTPPEAAVPAIPELATPKFRIQLHALRSEASATREWIKLRISHRDLFGGLGMTIVRSEPGPDGIRLARLQAGPFDGFGAANRLCIQARKRHLACVVVKP